MGALYSCDYCGETLDERDMGSVTMRLLVRVRIERLDFHSECWETVSDGLDMILSAGGSIERIPVQGEEEPRTRMGSSSRPASTRPEFDHDEFLKPYRAWKAIEQDQREQIILEAMGDERLTISEICEVVTSKNKELKPHDGTTRPVVTKMLNAGKLAREAEPWRGRVRYRYFSAGVS